MKQRMNAYEKGSRAMKALYGLGTYLAKSAIEQSLLNLIYFRVSQINGCAYCLDMHFCWVSCIRVLMIKKQSQILKGLISRLKQKRKGSYKGKIGN